MKSRNDLVTSTLIDAILCGRESSTPLTMALELIDQGVPADVALRVLARPQDRRALKIQTMSTNGID